MKRYVRLYEVRYEDIFGGEFVDFVKQFKKFKKNDNYFVQFTNYKDNTIDKSSHPDTDHSDPVGTYGYPLEYVIDNPADIWYGRNAKFLRVLVSKGKNTLYLQHMDNNDIERYLRKLKLWQGWGHFEMITKFFDHKGTVKDNKTFMSYIQMEVDTVENNKSKKPPVRSSQEQTNLFRKLGFHVVIDTARNHKSAIINNREPVQAIFLTPVSFNIETIFRLGAKDEEQGLTNLEPDKVQKKALVAKIFNGIGDRLKSNKFVSFDDVYWSHKGRVATLRFDHVEGYTDNKVMGQKNHREFKKSDHYVLNLTLETEYGNIHIEDTFNDRTYSDIIAEVLDKFNELEENPKETDFVLDTKEAFEARDKADRDAYFDTKYDKAKEDFKDNYLKETHDSINEYAKLRGIKQVSNKNINQNDDAPYSWFEVAKQLINWTGAKLVAKKPLEYATKENSSSKGFGYYKKTKDYKDLKGILEDVYDLVNNWENDFERQKMSSDLTGESVTFYWILRNLKESMGLD